MKNARINNDQRKEFAKLAEETLARKIQRARDEAGELVSQITEQVKKELGVDTMENQIQALQRQILAIEEKKQSLGFPKFQHQGVQGGSQARQLIDSRAQAQSQSLRDLHEKRTEIITKIWASTALDEAMAALDEAMAALDEVKLL